MASTIYETETCIGTFGSFRSRRFSRSNKAWLFILDEEEEYLRQIDELKQSTAKKDAELSQLRTELAGAIKVRNGLYNVTLNGKIDIFLETPGKIEITIEIKQDVQHFILSNSLINPS